MLRVTNDQTTQVGLAEDVTAATLERMRIAHERDYDIPVSYTHLDVYKRQMLNSSISSACWFTALPQNTGEMCIRDSPSACRSAPGW